MAQAGGRLAIPFVQTEVVGRAIRRRAREDEGHVALAVVAEPANRQAAERKMDRGRAEVENQDVRCVRREGNQGARQLVSDIFEVVPRKWRGIGEIPYSGLGLRSPYATFDAERRFQIDMRRFAFEQFQKMLA